MPSSPAARHRPWEDEPGGIFFPKSEDYRLGPLPPVCRLYSAFFQIFFNPPSKIKNPPSTTLFSIRNLKSEISNRYSCLMRQLCFKNYSETILHCHFYYDIQTLSLQRTDIQLNHCRFMYRNDMKCMAVKQVQNCRAFPLNPCY